MHLLYSGASHCDERTLKRLLLVASRLSFMDRPSVMTGHNRGTVGHESMIRRFNWDDSPVAIAAHAPQDHAKNDVYSHYLNADIRNGEIANIILNGLNDDLFAAKFLQLGANYGDGITGRLVRNALVRADDLVSAHWYDEFDPKYLFKIDSTRGLRATLHSLVEEASVQVTSALLVADALDAFPVSDEPHLLDLLAQRTTNKAYIGGTPSNSWLVGMEFARAAIPDEALQRLSLDDVIKYRAKTIDQYAAWSAEVNQVATKIDELTSAEAQTKIPKLIASELMPKLAAYRTDMAATRDELFAGLLKGVLNFKPPAVSLATFSTLGFGAAIAAFTATAAVPPIVDFFKERRKLSRKHGVSYLVGVSRHDVDNKD